MMAVALASGRTMSDRMTTGARIVLTSGYTDEQPMNGFEVDGFLPKPFKPADVTATVRRVLAKAP